VPADCSDEPKHHFVLSH